MVIPTLDEAQALPGLLAELARQDLDLEVIVADAGSRDATPGLARAAGAKVVQGERGRGAQMNQGARCAQGRELLFLHADSHLGGGIRLAEALHDLNQEQRIGRPVAGHFGLRFLGSRHDHAWLFRFLEAKSRSNRPATINGDQGLMIAQADFQALGGFDARLPFLEDQRFADRVFENGRWVLLPGVLGTSARRFERDGTRQTLSLMALILMMHAAGCEAFFERAPGLYRAQAETGSLCLGPFRALAAELLGDAPGAEAERRALGRFIRLQAWQLALLADMGLNRHGEWLSWHDRHLQPRLSHPSVDALCSRVARIWMRPRFGSSRKRC